MTTQAIRGELYLTCPECGGDLEHAQPLPKPYGLWRCADCQVLWAYERGGWHTDAKGTKHGTRTRRR